MSKRVKKVQAETETVETASPPVEQAKAGESLQVEELKKTIARKDAVIKEMKRPKGIASVINTDGTIKRPDEAFQESMPSAMSKSKPEDLTIPERNAVERELRRFIKRSGGFRKNLAKDLQERAEKLMVVIGRKKPEWDFTIDIPGFGDGHRTAGK